MFVLLIVIERRNPLMRRRLQRRPSCCWPMSASQPAEVAAADTARSASETSETHGNHHRQPDASASRSRSSPDVLLVRVPRLRGRHAGRHAARHRPARRHQHPAAGDVRARRHQAVIMLAGIYYGSQYGGSTTSILMRIPGEASSVMTCIDGYAMAQKGRAGAALCIAAVGSFDRRHLRRHRADRDRAAARRRSRCASARRNTPRCWCSA